MTNRSGSTKGTSPCRISPGKRRASTGLPISPSPQQRGEVAVQGPADRARQLPAVVPIGEGADILPVGEEAEFDQDRRGIRRGQDGKAGKASRSMDQRRH